MCSSGYGKFPQICAYTFESLQVIVYNGMDLCLALSVSLNRLILGAFNLKEKI